ncbi:MAG: hypothetical protein IJ733_09410 [Lachnospiraceae bacterium]|nr:hypothetical protein [Lachnospiraceae bacterium]
MSGHFYKRTFPYLFIFLLFMAEIFSVPNGNNPVKKQSRILYTISSGRPDDDSQTVLTAGIRSSTRDDIEIGRSIEKIDRRIHIVKGKSYSYKQNRRIGQENHIISGFSGVILRLLFYWMRTFIILGISVFFSLWFIIKYIHHKNGEKIDVFLSDEHFDM